MIFSRELHSNDVTLRLNMLVWKIFSATNPKDTYTQSSTSNILQEFHLFMQIKAHLDVARMLNLSIAI